MNGERKREEWKNRDPVAMRICINFIHVYRKDRERANMLTGVLLE